MSKEIIITDKSIKVYLDGKEIGVTCGPILMTKADEEPEEEASDISVTYKPKLRTDEGKFLGDIEKLDNDK